MMRASTLQLRDLSSRHFVLFAQHGENRSVLQELKKAVLKASLVNWVGTAVERLDAHYRKFWDHRRCADPEELSDSVHPRWTMSTACCSLSQSSTLFNHRHLNQPSIRVELSEPAGTAAIEKRISCFRCYASFMEGK